MRYTFFIVSPIVAALMVSYHLTPRPLLQQKKEQPIKVVERHQLISIDAEVMSRFTGLAITDLKHEDFIISENGIQQRIAAWQHLNVPLSLLILVDAVGADSVRLENEVAALKSSLSAQLKPGDDVGVMLLGPDPRLLQEYTSNERLISNALDMAVGSKNTVPLSVERKFLMAIQEAANHAGDHGPISRRAIILISDLPEITANKVFLPEWILRTVLDSGSIFCWKRPKQIHPHSSADNVDFEKVTLASLPDVTGGESASADWRVLFSRLRERYQIAYWPDTLGRAGDVVRIKLELRNTSKRGTNDLDLVYRRFAIIP